ncbi:MAG: hypothetical protein Q4D51_03875 [Eubacteriales bacterium]|nr:hypothetical protein [Eubacteriales bacterium]
MKKTLYFLILCFFATFLFIPTAITAQANTVKLDKTNFPDPNLRNSLSSYKDQDDMIDTEYITSLNVAEIKNGKGFELLTSLERLDLVKINASDFTLDNPSVQYLNMVLGEEAPNLHLNIPNVNTFYIKTYNGKLKYKTVTSISGLSNATNLETLYIHGLKQKSFSLKGLTNLKTFELVNCSVKTITDWEACPNLENIYLHNLALESLQVTCPLKKVHFLALYQNKNLTSVNITGMKNVATARLYENQKLTSLKLPNKIEELAIYKDPIKSLDLSNFKKLEYLRAGGSGLKKLILKNNKKLTRIDLNKTKVSSLNFSQIPNLECLDIGHTKFKGTMNLKKLKKFERLNLSYTAVHTVLLSDTSKKKLAVLGVTNSKLKNIDLTQAKYLTIRWDYEKYKKNITLHLNNILKPGYILYGKGYGIKTNIATRTFQLTSKNSGYVTLHKGNQEITIQIQKWVEQY